MKANVHGDTVRRSNDAMGGLHEDGHPSGAGVLPRPFHRIEPPTLHREQWVLGHLGSHLAVDRAQGTPRLLSALLVVLRKLTWDANPTVGVSIPAMSDGTVEAAASAHLRSLDTATLPSATTTFRELVGSVRSALAGAPSESSTGAGRRPFDVVFVFRQDPSDRLALGDVASTPVEVFTGQAKYALQFEVLLRADDIVCTVEYRPDLVCASVATSLAEWFGRVLPWLCDHPDLPVASAPLLDDAEVAALLRLGTGPVVELPAPSVHRAFEQQALRSPSSIAAVGPAQTLTYAELDALANRLAHALLDAGVRPGDRVPLVLSRSPLALAAGLAVLKVGAAYAPLDPDEPEERKAALLADLAATVVLTERDLEAHAGAPALRRVLVDDPALAARSAASLDHDGAPDDAAYVMFTSGSTGRPKGVVVPHRGVLRLVHGQHYADFGPECTWLHLAPPWFDASTLEVWAPLLHGGRCVVFPARVPDFGELAAALHAHHVDSLWLTSTLFNAVVDHDPAVLRGLRQLLVGGEVLSPTHVRRAHEALPHLRLVNGYGPTENTTFTAYHPITDADLVGGAPIPIGRPLAGTRVRVVDADGHLAPVGVPGELCAAGDGVALGYLGLPEATNERFVPDPWARDPRARMYRTGDLVRWRDDRTLLFLGRKDRQIKIRGFRVEPAEIEAVLTSCPGVKEAVVLPSTHPLRGTELVAYVVGTESNAASLRADLAARLPAAMVPTRFEFVPRVPRTATGKVDATALASAAHPTGGEPAGDAPPHDETERAVLAAFRSVLGNDAIGLDDDFLLSGGHSLLAARIVARLRSHLGVALRPEVIRTSATPRSVADAVRSALGQSEPARPDVRPPSIAPLTEGQRGLWLEHHLDPSDPAFHVPIAFRIEGKLDVPALQRAFARLVERHGALRTRFVDGDPEPLQVVDASSTRAFEVEEVRAGLDLDERARSEARRPFDLATGRAHRALLLRSPRDSSLLLLTFHHIVIDEWSLDVLVGELGQFYDAELRGKPPELAPIELAAAAASSWLRRRRPAAAPTAGVDCALPGPDVAPVDADGRRFESSRSNLSAHDLAKVAAIDGATPFELALSVFFVALRGMLPGRRLTVATPRTLRDGAVLGDTVGYFLEMVPVEMELRNGQTTREVLTAVRGALSRAREPRIKGAGRRPFDVVFVFRPSRPVGLRLGDAVVEERPVWTGSAKYTFGLEVIEGDAGLRCTAEFRPDRVSGQAATELVDRFERLLARACAAPGAPIVDADTRKPLESERSASSAGSADRHRAGGTAQGPSGAHLERRPSERAHPTAPGSELERAVLSSWSHVLGSDAIGLDDDFSLAGGHSLLAVRLGARLESSLGVRLPVRELLAARTPRGMAARIAREQRAASSRPDALRSSGPQPLTPGQLALWMEHRLDPGSAAFHVPLGWRLDGPLDVEALGRALEWVARRHDGLRSRFIDSDIGPVQVVDAVPSVQLVVEDVGDRDEIDVERRVRSEAVRPYDLAGAAPWRARLFRLARDRHLLLLGFHHIVVDDWAVGIIASELQRAYAATRRGQPPELPPPRMQMPDAAAARLEAATPRGGTPGRRGDRCAWPPPFEAVAAGSDARVALALGADVASAARRADRRLGASAFERALAAFAVLARRLTGAEHVVVATPRTLREGAELADVVGYLIDLASIELDVGTAATFRELVGSVRSALAGVPSESSTGAGRRPFDVVFVFRQDPSDRLALGDVTSTPVEVFTGEAKYALQFEVLLRGDDVVCTVEYRPDVVCASVATSLAEWFGRVLPWLCDHPDLPVASAPLLDDAEVAALLRLGTGPAVELPAPSVHRAFERQALRSPTSIAAVGPAQTLTYADLDALANRIAHALLDAGVRPGDRVPLVLSRSPLALAAGLAVLKVGAAYAPLDPDEPEARKAALLADLAAAVVVTERDLEPRAGPSALRRVLVDDPTLAARSPAPLDHDGSPDDAAYVMFTSGSTGRPKGVVVPHRGVLRLVHGQHYADFGPERTWLHLAPPWFDASTLEVWAPLLHGGRCVVFPARVPDFGELAAALHAHHVDSLWLTSTLFNAVVDHDPAVLRGLRQLLVGGEVLSPTHVRRAHEALPHLRLVNGYGPTENTTFTACHPITDADLVGGAPIPIGRPLAGTRVRVVDTDGHLVPVGVPGELCAAGDGVALGYLGLPEATNERFVPDPWAHDPRARMYRTGDLVRWRDDGTLLFLGRKDRQIKIRGFRVEPAEIEAVLISCPGVKEAVVLAATHPLRGTELVAYVVGPPDDEPSRAALRRTLQARLPSTMIPAIRIVPGGLPRTLAGKLDEARLPVDRPVGVPGSPPDDAPRTDLERHLADVWSDVLQRPTIGRSTDFFDLGGTSLLALRVLSRIEAELGRRLPAASFFRLPTVAHLAEMVDGRADGREPVEVVQLAAGAAKSPLFVLPSSVGQGSLDRAFAHGLDGDRPVFELRANYQHERFRGAIDLSAHCAEFADALCRVRPSGDFLLCGYSWGGLAAYETARLLAERGRTVAFLGIIDAEPFVKRTKASRARRLWYFLRNLPYWYWDHFRLHAGKAMFRHAGIRLRGMMRPHRKAPTAHFQRIFGGLDLPAELRTAVIRNIELVQRYTPAPYAGPVTLFRARARPLFPSVMSLDSGWGPFVTGRLDVVQLKCHHSSILAEPHLSQVVRVLRDRMARS